jgi:hypothetical protein
MSGGGGGGGGGGAVDNGRKSHGERFLSHKRYAVMGLDSVPIPSPQAFFIYRKPLFFFLAF